MELCLATGTVVCCLVTGAAVAVAIRKSRLFAYRPTKACHFASLILPNARKASQSRLNNALTSVSSVTTKPKLYR